jgi:hypothetical protein
MFSPGLTTGATKAAINQGFALRDNLGDITAKGTTPFLSLLLTSHATLQLMTLQTTQQATRRALWPISWAWASV